MIACRLDNLKDEYAALQEDAWRNTRTVSQLHISLNVDLAISSTYDLQPIVNRFGRADSTIRAFCGLIESLPKAERTLWNNAAARSFSIGVQAGTYPNCCDFAIRPKTVKAASDLAAQIVLTIYAPEQSRKHQR